MIRLERAAREALAYYKAIGMGPSGWNSRDRIAFEELEAAFNGLPPEPAAPAQRQLTIPAAPPDEAPA